MISYPNIDPEIIHIGGGFGIRWYGVMYFLAFAISLFLVKKFFRERKIFVSNEFIADLILAALIGVIIGGRLGHVLTSYQSFYFSNPIEIFKIWKGGMGFFGGVVGVAISIYIFSKIQKISFYKIMDLIIPCVPIGIGLVRIGNFINGELYGRITKSPICMYFPADPQNCRYPSQLLQFLLEGVALFLILFFLRKKEWKPGTLSWLFIVLYGIFRFIAEFWREPQPEQPLIFSLTLAQIFSIIMIVAGMAMILKINWLEHFHFQQQIRKKS